MNPLRTLFQKFYYDYPRKLTHGYVLPCRNYVFEMTYRCNLDCYMCSFVQETKKLKDQIVRKQELSLDEWKRVFMQTPYKSNVTFTGGEVYVKKGFHDLLREAATRFRIIIATNGVFVTDEIAEDFVRWGICSVGTSIDGDLQSHTRVRKNSISFTRAIECHQKISHIKKEMKRSLPLLNVNTVILPENIEVLHKVPEIAKEAGADTLSFQVLDPSFERSASRLRDDIDLDLNFFDQMPDVDISLLREKLELAMRRAEELNLPFSFTPPYTLDEVIDYYDKKIDLARYKCSLPFVSTRISPYGDVYPCLNLKIGNVREAPLFQILNSYAYREFRCQMDADTLPDACIGCCKMTRKPDMPIR